MEKHNKKKESNPEFKNYWVTKLSGEIPTLNLPSSKLRPTIKSNNGHAFRSFFSKSETEIVHNFILNTEGNLFTCLLATWNILFYRYTSQRDIYLGTRIIDENDTSIGNQDDLFCKTMIFRATLEPFESFTSFYDRINKSQLLDDKNQPYFADQLVIDLDIKTDKSRNAIFDIMVSFNKTKFISEDLNSSFINPNIPKDLGVRNSILDIEITFQEIEDILCFDIVYNTDVYERDMIESLILHFKTLLLNLITQPTKNLDEVNYIAEQELELLLNDFNKTEIEYPKNKTIIDLFLSRVEKNPDNVAVIFNDQQLTYDELDKLSNQLANYLSSKHQIFQGDVVSILAGRSEMLIICLLGVLKSGAAYVPIDPAYPQQRINYKKNDSNCKFTLDSTAIEDFLSTKEKYTVNPPSLVLLKPNDLAYIIYTSGSTGNPKGVMIEHCNLLNYLVSSSNYIDTNSINSGCFAHLSLSFDASITELFLPLIFGKKLILSSGTGLKIFDDPNLFKYAPYDFIKLTPSHISILTSVIDKANRPQLATKYIIGGEALYNYHINFFKSSGIDAIIVNEYGPTEATVGCSIYEFNTFDPEFSGESIPIGKPISNTKIYILDKNQQLLPIGKVGEICIAGNGVARGYINRQDLNLEKFCDNPFDIGTQMYRTGDLGKWLLDGNLLYSGRFDEQVKINGYRIELGEIEYALMTIDSIKSAVVLAKTDLLVAFIVADIDTAEEQNSIRLWRNELALQVPNFMVPHVFYLIEQIPITSNGKIDRKALLEHKSNSESKQKYTHPRTEEEKLVAAIWKECLNLDTIDIFSDFFEMGGHSIKAVKVMSEIKKRTGKEISLFKILENSTIEKFAKLLNSDNEIDADCLVPLKSNGNKVPLFMVHGGGLNVLSLVNMSKHFDDDQPFYGIQGVGPKGYENWYESIEAMAAHYIDAIVKMHPKGPYAIAGFCIGGIVAFEMTRQLKEQGKEVSMTVFLDSYVDSSYYYKTQRQKKLVRYYHHTRRRLGFLKEMLLSWKAFKMRIRAKKEYIQQRHFSQENKMTELESLAHEQFITATSMVKKILDRYHLKPQRFKVDLLRSKDHPAHVLAPSHLGWEKAALNGVTIHTIQGDNFDIGEPPHDKVLARMLQDLLDERHTND